MLMVVTAAETDLALDAKHLLDINYEDAKESLFAGSKLALRSLF